MANETTTRASVTPRLSASAPERASFTIASATACGSGSMRTPAICEPSAQTAKNSRSEASLTSTAAPLAPMRRKRYSRKASETLASLGRGGLVEGAGGELTRRADEFGAANVGEHTVEGARVGFLLGDRAA